MSDDGELSQLQTLEQEQPSWENPSLSDLKELKVSPNALTSEVHLGHLESRSMVAMPELLQSPPFVPLEFSKSEANNSC